MPDAPLRGRRHRPGLARGRERRGRVHRVVGMQQIDQWLALEIRRHVAEQTLDRGAHVPQHAAGVRDRDHVGRMLHERAEPRLVLTRRGLGEKPRVLPHRRQLPKYDQTGEGHAPDGEERPALPGLLDRLIDQQAVTHHDREVRQQRERLDARSARRARPLPLARRRRIGGVALARPRQHQIRRHECHVGPFDPAVPDALDDEFTRQVGRDVHRNPEQKQDERDPARHRQAAQHDGGQAQRDSRITRRVRDVEEARDQALRTGERGRNDDEIPHGDADAEENGRRIVQELPLLGPHTPRARERQQRDQPARIQDQIRNAE